MSCNQPIRDTVRKAAVLRWLRYRPCQLMSRFKFPLRKIRKQERRKYTELKLKNTNLIPKLIKLMDGKEKHNDANKKKIGIT